MFKIVNLGLVFLIKHNFILILLLMKNICMFDRCFPVHVFRSVFESSKKVIIVKGLQIVQLMSLKIMSLKIMSLKIMSLKITSMTKSYKIDNLLYF